MLITAGLELLWPQFQRLIIDKALVQGRYDLLPIFSLGILGLFILRGLFTLMRGYFSQSLAQSAIYDIRSRVFDHIQRLSFSYHDTAETGQLISRTTADIDALTAFLGVGILHIVVNWAVIVGILFICIRMN